MEQKLVVSKTVNTLNEPRFLQFSFDVFAVRNNKFETSQREYIGATRTRDYGRHLAGSGATGSSASAQRVTCLDIATTAMVTSLLVHLFVCVTVTATCEFPDFVQSRRPNAKRREWYRHVTSGRGQPLIVNFFGDVMESLVIGTNETFSRECTFEISPGSFLSAQKNDANDRVSFVCMRFQRRSDDVIQVLFSRLSDNEDPSLCNDASLRLDDWPLINRANFLSSYEPCPLQGGFNMWIFDKKQSKGICDSYT